MALTNKFGGLLLTTGNKSEYAVGYATIYGDMCGGYAPLKDLYKTEVWELARKLGIPDPIINKKPSAGLWSGQTDEADLGMPYETLDKVLKLLEDCRVSVRLGTGYARSGCGRASMRGFRPACVGGGAA